MLVQASYSFVNDRLLLFIYAQHETKDEKKYEDPVYQFMSSRVRYYQSDLDSSSAFSTYDRDMFHFIEIIFNKAFNETQIQFEMIQLKLEMKRIIGTA